MCFDTFPRPARNYVKTLEATTQIVDMTGNFIQLLLLSVWNVLFQNDNYCRLLACSSWRCFEVHGP